MVRLFMHTQLFRLHPCLLQGERIERIDLDTEASVANVESAHVQIQKYAKYVSANRGLIIKVFAVLFFLIVLFGTVMR